MPPTTWHLLLSSLGPGLGSECRLFLRPEIFPFLLWPLLSGHFLNSMAWSGEEKREISRRRTRRVSSLILLQTNLFPHLAPFFTSPESKAFLAQTLSSRFVHTVWQSSLTLTVFSGREVEAASFPRATESGYFPRWNSAEIEPHSKGMGREAGHEAPLRPLPHPLQPYTPLFPKARPSIASTSQSFPTGLRAIASMPHPEHLDPGPSTFLQRFSLAWGEDRPIPVASPWVGTPGSLRATVGIARNWS